VVGLRKNVNRYNTQQDPNFPTLQEALRSFVTNERNRLSKEPGMQHHYAQFINESQPFPSDNAKGFRFYPKSELRHQTDPNKLIRSIKYAYNLQYKPNYEAMKQAVKRLEQEAIKGNMSDQRLITTKFTGVDPTSGKYYRNSMVGRIGLFFNALRNGDDLPKLRLDELRIIAQNMNGHHIFIPDDSIVIPNESVLYRSNGFDSRPDNPNKRMPVIPFLAQTPQGQIIYDLHNGNLMGKHLKKYGQEVKEFLRTWGRWAEVSLPLIQSRKTWKYLQNYARDNKGNRDHDPKAAYDALKVIMGNRTGGDSVYDLTSAYETYEDFKRNVLERSTHKDFSNYYKFSKMQSSGTYNLINPGENIAGNLNNIISELNRIINASVDPEQTLQLAAKDIQELGITLTRLYQQHPDQFTWDNYTSSIAALSGVVGPTGRSVVKTNSVSQNDDNQRLDEEGFDFTKKVGTSCSEDDGFHFWFNDKKL